MSKVLMILIIAALLVTIYKLAMASSGSFSFSKL